MKKRNIAIQVTFILAIIGIALWGGRAIMHPAPSTGFMTVKNFVTAYYTVSQGDYNYYKSTLKDGVPTDKQLTDSSYIKTVSPFEPYLSDLSYIAFTSSRLSYKRVLTAYKNNVIIKVKNVAINENFKNANTKAKTKEYHYVLLLNEKDRKTGITKVVSRSAVLTVIFEKNTWRILNLKPTSLTY